MRNNLTNPNAKYLKYAIREMALVVDEIKKIDPNFKFVPENIGDPIMKGWVAPDYLKEIVVDLAKNKNESWAYVHSKGQEEAREWVVKDAKRCYPEAKVTVDDILFANGLGAAIGILYSMLPKGARVIGPTPSYPTHSSLESFAASADRISYRLDPNNDWQIDFSDLEEKLEKYSEITGILLINPNNPTGAVYEKETIDKIVALAKKYNLFIIADEIYFRMVYNGKTHYHMSVACNGEVPLVVMRGISKDVPWPGSRCGWIEFHNRDADKGFDDFCAGISQRILLEVCATSLPQYCVPKIYKHPDFPKSIEENNKKLEENSKAIAEILNSIPEVNCNPASGAFYITVVFKEGSLNDKQALPIENSGLKEFIEKAVSKEGLELDWRLSYYILAATGLVVTPATGFYSEHQGFRVTTLERDPEKLRKNYEALKEAIVKYLASA